MLPAVLPIAACVIMAGIFVSPCLVQRRPHQEDYDLPDRRIAGELRNLAGLAQIFQADQLFAGSS